MVYARPECVRPEFAPGTRKWGTAFALDTGKTGHMLYQEPVLGELCC